MRFNSEDIMSYRTDVTVPRFRDAYKVINNSFEQVGIFDGQLFLPCVNFNGELLDVMLYECLNIDGAIVYVEEKSLSGKKCVEKILL